MTATACPPKSQLGTLVQDQEGRGDQDDVCDEKIRRDRSRLFVFCEPPADEGSPQGRAYRHRHGVDPAATREILSQLTDRGLVGLAELAPGDRHRPDERAREATEKDCWRDRDRNS